MTDVMWLNAVADRDDYFNSFLPADDEVFAEQAGRDLPPTDYAYDNRDAWARVTFTKEDYR